MNAGGTGGSETVYFEPTDTFTIAELTVRRSVICYIPPTRTFVRPPSRLLHAIFMLMRCNKGHRIRSPYIPHLLVARSAKLPQILDIAG